MPGALPQTRKVRSLCQLAYRCALCWSVETARLARQHNDANVISLGQRVTEPELALEIVRTWLATEFEGGRHLERIQQIAELEAAQRCTG